MSIIFVHKINQKIHQFLPWDHLNVFAGDLIRETCGLQHGKLLLTIIDLNVLHCRSPRLGQQEWAKRWVQKAPPKHLPQTETLGTVCGEIYQRLLFIMLDGHFVHFSPWWWIHFQYFNYYEDTPNPQNSRHFHSVHQDISISSLRQRI